MTTFEAIIFGCAMTLAVDRAIDGRFWFAAAYGVMASVMLLIVGARI